MSWASNSGFLYAYAGETFHAHVNGETLEMVCLSAHPGPLVFRVDRLASAEECDRVITLAVEKLEKSHVMGSPLNTSDEGVNSSESYRKSAQAWISAQIDATLQELQRRLATLLRLPLHQFQ